MASSASVIGVLLAAGQGRRFGSDKRVARLPNGATLLQQSYSRLHAAVGSVLVVIGAGQTEWLQGQLGFRPASVEAPADSGMGDSIACAFAGLGGDGVAGALLALADMPWIAPQTYASIVCASEPDSIILPVYGGRRGHPVFFGRHYFAALAQCRGEAGARHLLTADWARVRGIAVSDSAVVRDVDTPADLCGLGDSA